MISKRTFSFLVDVNVLQSTEVSYHKSESKYDIA